MLLMFKSNMNKCRLMKSRYNLQPTQRTRTKSFNKMNKSKLFNHNLKNNQCKWTNSNNQQKLNLVINKIQSNNKTNNQMGTLNLQLMNSNCYNSFKKKLCNKMKINNRNNDHLRLNNNRDHQNRTKPNNNNRLMTRTIDAIVKMLSEYQYRYLIR